MTIAATLIFLLLVLLGTNVEAGRIPHDSSGDPMQRHNSQMMASPMTRFPGIMGITVWPYIKYPPAPSTTIVNVEVRVPSLESRPEPMPTPPARPKFWIARCGSFVEIELSPAMSLIDEESKPCSP